MNDRVSSSSRADGMLLTIFELVTEGVKETLSEQEAVELGMNVVERIRHTFGGELVYVCQGRKLDSIIMSNQIWNEFDGRNQTELAKKYGCSVQWVYTVIRTMRKLKQDEVQGDLFGNNEGG